MPMTVQMYFEGNVIFYTDRQQRNWNIVFITDDVHEVSLSHNSSGSIPAKLRRAGVNRVFEVKLGTNAHPNVTKDPSFHRLLNMARTEIHGAERLNVTRRGTKGREWVWLTIPAGRVSEFEPTTDPYVVSEVGDLANVFYPGTVAKVVKLEFAVDAGFACAFDDTRDSSGSFMFPYIEGETLSLKFNNDCGSDCKGPDDFQMYYDWFEDRDGMGNERRFSARKVKDNSSVLDHDKQLYSFFGTEGNCDPVSCDPPPGP